ncbi:MAG: nucleotidyltransferase [Oligoflexia bacterium]|nr:nucleotidyltransferase [Oligoflexia bacterium]
MEILRTISSEAAANGVSFIVIGGHAVNAHGISRTTGDIDLMVKITDKEFWLGLLKKLNYSIRQETAAFVIANPPTIAAWPIDFMLVSDETFDIARADAVMFDHAGAKCQTASIQHLIAMKLHALRSAQPHRESKDFGDVLALVKVGAVDTNSSDFRQFCTKYGSIELYERILEASK